MCSVFTFIVHWFVWAASPRSQAIAMSNRYEKEKHWEPSRVEMGFSCVKYDLISNSEVTGVMSLV